MSTPVTRANFVRAETDRMFAALEAQASGVNRWHHSRVATPLDQQTVVRMNRDTLYSMAIVDISAGATITVPDAGDRYMSVMVVNEDHYINAIYHDPGVYRLSVTDFETPWVMLAARTLADPNDPEDLAQAHAIQDGLALDAASNRPFEPADWDTASLDAVRDELRAAAGEGIDASKAFGRSGEVDPEDHLLGTAAGWGGLPLSEAVYTVGPAGWQVGEYRLVVRDVPVDAFWSLSVYDREGFFVPNTLGVNSVNSVTAVKEPDGAVVIHLGGCGDGRVNCIPITDGWNYTVRLYRPRPEVADGTYQFPKPEAIPS